MSHLFNRLIAIFFYSDLHATRFTLATAEFIWAITLLWDGSTFGRPTYTQMATVMSENAWGLTFLVSAITQLSVLIRGDFHSRFATYFAGWNAMLWLYVTISMYMSVFPPPAAISGEAALALAAGWIWIRSGHIICGRWSTDN
jgi:hypothetical protein